MKLLADCFVGQAFGAEALGVLLRRKGDAPEDHQGNGEQRQHRCQQASDGGHEL